MSIEDRYATLVKAWQLASGSHGIIDPEWAEGSCQKEGLSYSRAVVYFVLIGKSGQMPTQQEIECYEAGIKEINEMLLSERSTDETDAKLNEIIARLGLDSQALSDMIWSIAWRRTER